MSALPNDAQIVAATLDDISGMHELVGRCIAAMRAEGIDQWDETYPSRGTFERDVQAESAFLLRTSTSIVGLYVLNQTQDREYAELRWEHLADTVCVVHRLMVDPAYQGRGAARLLMQDVDVRARAMGAGAIRLDAFDRNPGACAMYERLGYRYVGDVRFRKGVFRCYERRPVDL